MDRVNSASFPINHAINAYSRASGARPIAPLSRVQPTAPTAPVAPIAKIGPVGAAKGTAVGNRVDALVAGKVDSIDLVNDVNTIAAMTPNVQQTSAGTYSMYPQATDRNLAATGVAVGRSLDLRG
jgi:hypothetical protein